jgi:hypothetical protein
MLKKACGLDLSQIQAQSKAPNHLPTAKNIKTQNFSGNRKPLPWKLLWKVIKDHEGGTCDCYCSDFRRDELDIAGVVGALEWLKYKGYLTTFRIQTYDKGEFAVYKLNWDEIRQNLGVNPPPQLHPLTPEEFSQTEMGKIYEVLKNWKQALSKH